MEETDKSGKEGLNTMVMSENPQRHMDTNTGAIRGSRRFPHSADVGYLNIKSRKLLMDGIRRGVNRETTKDSFRSMGNHRIMCKEFQVIITGCTENGLVFLVGGSVNGNPGWAISDMGVLAENRLDERKDGIRCETDRDRRTFRLASHRTRVGRNTRHGRGFRRWGRRRNVHRGRRRRQNLKTVAGGDSWRREGTGEI